MSKFDRSDIAKLCEIGVIYGQLLEKGEVRHFEDLDESYDCFEEIFENWKDKKDTLTEEEKAYITAYANRALLESLGVK